MNKRLKYVFCNSNPAGGNTDIGVTAIDDKGIVYEGTVHGPALTNWLATNAKLTPIEGLNSNTGTEEPARRVG